MADGHAHARLNEMLDQGQRARHFRRERDETDAAAGGILTPAKIVDAGRHDVRSRMGAARALVRREVRPFHVDPGDRGMRKMRQHTCARRKAVEGPK